MCLLDIMPKSLSTLLGNSNILKVGVGASRDAIKVKDDLGLLVEGVINCEVFAFSKMRKASPDHQGASLQALCASVLGRWLEKPPHIRCSNWEANPLDSAQLEYAALDAYAGLRLYMALQLLPDRQIVPSCEPASHFSLQRAEVSQPSSAAPPVAARQVLLHLPPAKKACWESWHCSGWEPCQIAAARQIKVSTVLCE